MREIQNLSTMIIAAAPQESGVSDQEILELVKVLKEKVQDYKGKKPPQYFEALKAIRNKRNL